MSLRMIRLRHQNHTQYQRLMPRPPTSNEPPHELSGLGAQAEDDWRSACNSLAGLAETIMDGRQQGVSVAKMMEAIANEEEQTAQKLVEELIIAAYDQPRFSTAKMQRRTMEEFRDAVYLQCVKARRTEYLRKN
jgi:hypothetical protein